MNGHIEFNWQTADNLSIFAQIYQPVGRPRGVVCLVHGLGEHSSRYAHVAEAMVSADFALAALDLRGHGRSEGQRGHTPNLDVLLDDIDHLLAEAATRYPYAPRFLYGHSMGGNLVLNHVLRRRPSLAGVIATSPWLRLAKEPPAMRISIARLLNRFVPNLSQSNGLNPDHISSDPAEVQAYIQDSLNHNQITISLGLTVYDSGLWALQHAAEFPLPLLLVHGSEDQITSPQATQEFTGQAPSATYKSWSGLYHETHNERSKGEVISLLVDWLQSHTQPVA
jgi:alpha-beta hydrolase superfamily lysophospholipase